MDLDDAIENSLKCISLNVSIKQFQKDVINSYIDGLDTFCVAGTGCGKSMTYILCPILHDILKYGKNISLESLISVVIIVQPLKSLMNDQVSKLKILGLKATYVGEDQDYTGMSGYNYIIASPETISSSQFRKTLDEMRKKIVCIFVDESHCIQSL